MVAQAQRRSTPRAAAEPNLGYAPTYYPGVPDLASASAIEVRGGQAVQVEFRLRAQPVYEVAGVVTGMAPEQRGATSSSSTAPATPLGANVRFNPGRRQLQRQGSRPAPTPCGRRSFNRQGPAGRLRNRHRHRERQRNPAAVAAGDDHSGGGEDRVQPELSRVGEAVAGGTARGIQRQTAAIRVGAADRPGRGDRVTRPAMMRADNNATLTLAQCRARTLRGADFAAWAVVRAIRRATDRPICCATTWW